MRRLLSGLLLATLGALPWEAGISRAASDDAPTPEEVSAAAYSLKAHLDLEKTQLDRDRAAYAAAEQRRQALRDQISVLYTRIFSVIRESTPPLAEGEDLDSLEGELESAQQAEEAVREKLRRLRERIADGRERIALLDAKLAGLRRTLPSEPESLSGVWDVTYLPSGDRGVFSLRQSGTLVAGEYTQEGGWRGSLQGTLIRNKLVLQRIDSQQGHSADLEGVVSTDLRSVKGTWQSRLLSDGNQNNGAWTGKKRETRKRTDGGGSP